MHIFTMNEASKLNAGGKCTHGSSCPRAAASAGWDDAPRRPKTPPRPLQETQARHETRKAHFRLVQRQIGEDAPPSLSEIFELTSFEGGLTVWRAHRVLRESSQSLRESSQSFEGELTEFEGELTKFG